MTRLKVDEIYLNEVENTTPVTLEDYKNSQDVIQFFGHLDDNYQSTPIILSENYIIPPEQFYKVFCGCGAIKVIGYENVPKGMKKLLNAAGICGNGRYVLDEDTKYFFDLDIEIAYYAELEKIFF